MMNSRLNIDKDKVKAFCERNQVSKLAVFGSVLRDDFGPHSDVDILVDFVPGQTPGFFQLAEMEQELSSLCEHRKVDLRTPQDLSRCFRDQVVASAEVQYVR
jgi:uncharacterized protein